MCRSWCAQNNTVVYLLIIKYCVVTWTLAYGVIMYLCLCFVYLSRTQPPFLAPKQPRTHSNTHNTMWWVYNAARVTSMFLLNHFMANLIRTSQVNNYFWMSITFWWVLSYLLLGLGFYLFLTSDLDNYL